MLDIWGALLMVPQSDGSFLVTASAAGLVGALPYVKVRSLEDLRTFLEVRMQLAPRFVKAVMECAEHGQCYGRNIKLSDKALQAIQQGLQYPRNPESACG